VKVESGEAGLQPWRRRAGPEGSTSCLEQELSLVGYPALTAASQSSLHSSGVAGAGVCQQGVPDWLLSQPGPVWCSSQTPGLLTSSGCPLIAAQQLLASQSHSTQHPLSPVLPHLWLFVPSCRLWDMLVRQDQEEQLFHSYEAIEAQCSQLVEDQRVLEAQLAAPMSQLPALESSTEVLYWQLYNSSNQLQLSPPVRELSCSSRPCWVAWGCESKPFVPSFLGAASRTSCLAALRGRGCWPESCLVLKSYPVRQRLAEGQR